VIGDLPLHKISIREIEHFLSVKKAEASEWTARKYYTALASAFEKAIGWNFLSDNPFRKVPKPKGKETYPLFFSRTEFEHLLSFITDKDFRELCITALFTGARLGELLSLEWSDIDFPQRIATIQNKEAFQTKSKRNRVVPLNDTLLPVLMQRQRDALSETGYVFHRRGMKLKENFVSKTFKRDVRLSGLNPALHFHSLRHSFATWLVQDGVSIYAIKELLGHADVKTTQVYSHLTGSDLHKEVNRISIALN
jgi:integrase